MTEKDKLRKEYGEFLESKKYSSEPATSYMFDWFLTKLSENEKRIKTDVTNKVRKQTLDLIAQNEGWEETRNIYAVLLGVKPKKYRKNQKDN